MVKKIQPFIEYNLFLVASLMFLFTWLFEVRFSSLLFRNSSQVLQSSYFSLAAAIILLALLPLIGLFIRKIIASRIFAMVTALFVVTCAILATLLPYFDQNSGNSDWLYVVAGLFYGVLTFGIIIWGILIFKQKGLINSCYLLVISTIGALLMLLLLNWVIPWEKGFFQALLPVLSGVFFLVYSITAKNSYFAGIYEPGVPLESKSRLLHSLLLFTGFFVVYMPTMFPKTTNLALYYFPDFSLGGLNYISLVALILFITFLIFILWYVHGNKITTPIVAFFITVVIAFVFYFLSSMSTSNLAFMIIQPCSMIFSLWASMIFLSSVDLGDESKIRWLEKGLFWMFFGGLSASIFSTLFLGLFFNTSIYQDTIIVLVTGSVFIIILALFVGIRDEIKYIVFPRTVFKEKLDSSTIENRCKLIAVDYKLTNREHEVLLLLAEGRNEPYIAENLSVSRATAKTHIKHIYQKVSVSSRQELLDFLHRS